MNATDRRPRGRAVLGAFAGFLLFLFVAIDLLLFGVIPLQSALITVLPLLGILIGVVWGRRAPLGRKQQSVQ